MVDAAKLSAQLEALGTAPDVAAVVLRVSSPGGSALGSDTLHRCAWVVSELSEVARVRL